MLNLNLIPNIDSFDKDNIKNYITPNGIRYRFCCSNLYIKHLFVDFNLFISHIDEHNVRSSETDDN